jgi:MoaD family protein
VKLQLKFFLPMLSEAVGKDEMEFDFDGRTVGDLIAEIARRHGRRAADAIFDKQGELDREVQVLVNQKTWVTRENVDAELADGDRVTIMVLMAGG